MDHKNIAISLPTYELLARVKRELAIRSKRSKTHDDVVSAALTAYAKKEGV